MVCDAKNHINNQWEWNCIEHVHQIEATQQHLGYYLSVGVPPATHYLVEHTLQCYDQRRQVQIVEEKPRQNPAVAHCFAILRHGEVERELCHEN